MGFHFESYPQFPYLYRTLVCPACHRDRWWDAISHRENHVGEEVEVGIERLIKVLFSKTRPWTIGSEPHHSRKKSKHTRTAKTSLSDNHAPLTAKVSALQSDYVQCGPSGMFHRGLVPICSDNKGGEQMIDFQRIHSASRLKKVSLPINFSRRVLSKWFGSKNLLR